MTNPVAPIGDPIELPAWLHTSCTGANCMQCWAAERGWQWSGGGGFWHMPEHRGHNMTMDDMERWHHGETVQPRLI